MSATLLDGVRIANEIKTEVAADVKQLSLTGLRPGLAAVLVGHDPGSAVYVRSKVKACETLGIFSSQIVRPDLRDTDALLEIVRELNRRDEIDGILVQLPLPREIDSRLILLEVDPAKDVDGFHPFNVGNLSANHPTLVACTPLGVMEILRRSNVAIERREAVVVGRSDIVGRPMAMLLTNANATVTVCHTGTKDMTDITRQADILVAAVGKAKSITADMVTPGTVVIGVGVNFVPDPATGKNKQVGDVDFDAVKEVASAITPVPGGTGAVTSTVLMANTVRAAEALSK